MASSAQDILWADMSDDSDEEQAKGPRNLLHRKRLEREANAQESTLPPPPPRGGPPRRSPMKPRDDHQDRRIGGNNHRRAPHEHSRGGGHMMDSHDRRSNTDRQQHFDRHNRPNNILTNRRQHSISQASHSQPASRSLAADFSSSAPQRASLDLKKPKFSSILMDLTTHADEVARNPSIFGEGKPREAVLHDKESPSPKSATSTAEKGAPADAGAASPLPPAAAAGEANQQGSVEHQEKEVLAEEGQPGGAPPLPQAPQPPEFDGGANHLPTPAQTTTGIVIPACVEPPVIPAAPQPGSQHYQKRLVSGSRPTAPVPYYTEVPPQELIYAPAMYRQPQYGYPMCYLPPTGAMPTADGGYLDPLGRPTDAYVHSYGEAEQAQTYGGHRYPQVYSAAANPMRPPMPLFANPVERLGHAPQVASGSEPPPGMALAEPPHEVVTFSRTKNVINRRTPPPPPPRPPPPPPLGGIEQQSNASNEKKSWAAVASASKS